uniref:Ovule protein n=1 Tax=Panagrolaimus sp. PS1159 TaxID=55785 RepID=A0AC35EZR8_9BILA
MDNKEVSAILSMILPYFADTYSALGCFSLLFMSPSTRRAYISFWTCNKIMLKGSKFSKAHLQLSKSVNNVTRIQ